MKGRWIDHCEEYVGNTEHSLLTLVSQGVILTREGTICSSFEHASDIVHGYHQRKSWSDPAPLMYVRTPEIRAHRLAVSAGVPLPDFDHKTLPSRYIISPPHLIETSSRLCNLIIATCTIETSRNTMRKKRNRDGLELIKLEYASVRRYLDKKACETIALAMDGFIRLGLVELSQSCFAELRGDFEGWNKVQETDRKMSEALICGKYVQLVERHPRLDLHGASRPRLDSRARAGGQHRGQHGRLPKGGREGGDAGFGLARNCSAVAVRYFGHCDPHLHLVLRLDEKPTLIDRDMI